MFTVEAVYQGGVFKPLGEVKLEENQRVRLTIVEEKQFSREEVEAWLERVRRYREELEAKYGVFPDSALSIAEDRMRDV